MEQFEMESHPRSVSERLMMLEEHERTSKAFADETRKMIAGHEKQCAERWAKIKLIGVFVLGLGVAGFGTGIYNAKTVSDVAASVAKIAISLK